MPTHYIIAHDIGTTSHKCSLVALNHTAEIVASKINNYALHISSAFGYVEQEPEDWWQAICKGSRALQEETGIAKDKIKGIVFCAQMQGFVPVNKEGEALRRAMNFLDGRANKQIEENLYHGILKVNGWNAYKALKTLYLTGGLSATPKDPLWKYHWMRENEPEKFKHLYKWLDVKDYLLHRSTGQFCCTMDSANLTFLFDTRKGHFHWHKGLCRLFKIDQKHLPNVVPATEIVGGLTSQAATEMNLPSGTPVIAGGGDASLLPIGAGCTDLYQTHIYIGTSGWVSSVQQKRKLDIFNFIASIVGAIPGYYNYIAEQETAGICLQWVKKNLADDGQDFYHYLDEAIQKTEPGSGGVIFAPWLQGNRAPREDNFARGLFFNIQLQTNKMQLVRAVMEGVAFHMKWMLEAMEKKMPYQKAVRFIGGGACSDAWGQILADITERKIEIVANPQNGGTIGAALVAGVGLGVFPSLQSLRKVIKVGSVFCPRKELRSTYNRSYRVFQKLYHANKKLFRDLNFEMIGEHTIEP